MQIIYVFLCALSAFCTGTDITDLLDSRTACYLYSYLTNSSIEHLGDPDNFLSDSSNKKILSVVCHCQMRSFSNPLKKIPYALEFKNVTSTLRKNDNDTLILVIQENDGKYAFSFSLPIQGVEGVAQDLFREIEGKPQGELRAHLACLFFSKKGSLLSLVYGSCRDEVAHGESLSAISSYLRSMK